MKAEPMKLKAWTRNPESRVRRFPKPPTNLLILLLAICTACAASNYNFDALSEVGASSRGVRLAKDLALEKDRSEGEGLFEIEVLPLTRTHLTLFAEEDEEDNPGGFIEADLRAYLPLFGIIDGSVNRYTPDHRLYERHHFHSYFWGLFQTHRAQMETSSGPCETKTRRLLWILEW